MSTYFFSNILVKYYFVNPKYNMIIKKHVQDLENINEKYNIILDQRGAYKTIQEHFGP